jgi:7-cyano-7-deazaguanine synthase in queuosine biosynthesis
MDAVLLNSGGKDALAAAILLTREGHRLHSLYLDGGQPGSRAEQEISAEIAAKYCVSHHVGTFGFGGLSVVNPCPPHPEIVTIPHKLLFSLVMGAIYADLLGVPGLGGGHRCDVAPRGFESRVAAVLGLSKLRTAPKLLLPLGGVDGTQGDFVYETIKDEPLWKKTICCLCETPCGTCARCKMRSAWLGRGSSQ